MGTLRQQWFPLFPALHPLPVYGSFPPLSGTLNLLQHAADLSVSGLLASVPPSGKNVLGGRGSS